MKAGGSKQKGSSFEREVCAALSLWITNGKDKDVFWRSAMSGGRATVHVRKGVANRQAGDICAVAPEGHQFTDRWFIECKHVKNLELASFLLNGTGLLAGFWRKLLEQAEAHNKEPMLIAQQNRMSAIVMTNSGKLTSCECLVSSWKHGCDIYLFSDMVYYRRRR